MVKPFTIPYSGKYYTFLVPLCINNLLCMLFKIQGLL